MSLMYFTKPIVPLIPDRDAEEWFTREAVSFVIDDRYRIDIPEGFSTDGATIPKRLWWIVPPWGRHTMPSILHDYLYRVGKVLDTKTGDYLYAKRKFSDDLFVDVMKDYGVRLWKRAIFYFFVRSFGWLYYGVDLPENSQYLLESYLSKKSSVAS